MRKYKIVKKELPIDPRMKELMKLDEQEPKTFKDIHPDILDDSHFEYPGNFLYHGIRFQEYLEKFIEILRVGKICSGKDIDNYYLYSDNCNDGEYVSLLEYSSETKDEYHAFIESNVSFLITPLSPAIKTIYVPYDLWEYIDMNSTSLRNRFSYAKGEYHAWDSVPLKDVRAVGIPYRYMERIEGVGKTNKFLKDIMTIMKYYGYDFTIVDTSNYNMVLYSPKNQNTIFKTYLKSFLDNK